MGERERRFDAKENLRKALTEVRIAPAYEAAVEYGIREARAWTLDNDPVEQLRHARRAALYELARLLGWDIK